MKKYGGPGTPSGIRVVMNEAVATTERRNQRDKTTNAVATGAAEPRRVPTRISSPAITKVAVPASITASGNGAAMENQRRGKQSGNKRQRRQVTSPCQAQPAHDSADAGNASAEQQKQRP
jgi:hypothetical protein